MEIPLKLWRPADWIARNQTENMIQGVFFGALGVMILYNIFVFFSVRNYSYLFYVAFVFSYFSFQALMKGYASQYLFPDHQQIFAWALPLMIGLSSLFSTGFAMSFLKYYESRGFFNRVLHATAGFFTLCIVAIPITSYRLIVTTLSIGATLSCLVMLAAGISRMLSGKKEARFYVLAWAIYTVGGVLFGLSKLGLISSNFFTSNAQQIGALVEVLLISMALADRLNTLRRENQAYSSSLALANSNLEAANAKLKEYVGHIEEVVDMKTRNIKSIFATIRAGIFTVGSDMMIEKEYSPFLITMLGKPIDETTNPVAYLFSDSDLRRDVQSAVHSTLIGAIGEPLFAWEVNMDQLPREFTIKKSDKTFVLTCEFSPIARNELVEKVLVVVRDITEMRALEMESQERKRELELLAQLSHVDANRFRMLIHSVRQWVTLSERLLDAETTEAKARAIQTIFIHIHTLKGNSRSLGLLHLAEISHDAEHYLTEVRGQLELWNPLKIREILRHIQDVIDECEFVFINRLGRSTTAAIQIATANVQKSLAALSNAQWEAVNRIAPVKELIDLLSKSFWRDAGEFIAELMRDAERLAHDLGKEPPQIMIEADSIKLPARAQDFFFQVMTHLLRNALDHGIEFAEERQRAGKNLAGKIYVKMRQSGEDVHIQFYDDGRGVDLGKVLSLAKHKNIADSNVQYSDEEIAQFILLPGFSTRSAISKVSGRGVGLDAVVSNVRDHGGKLGLKLGREVIDGYRSLTFEIVLPASLFQLSFNKELQLVQGF
jgi:signal transduction histidine kinase